MNRIGRSNPTDPTGKKPYPMLHESQAQARSATVIGVASGLGASDPGCGDGPVALVEAGFPARMRERGAALSWRATLAPKRHVRQSRYHAIADICARLAREVRETLHECKFPIVIGGDHSCAIGTWSGAARAIAAHGSLGLVWIDAHMDSHTPRTSHTGMPHGMPLAALLGHGAGRHLASDVADMLTDGQLAPRHICLVGVRSHEPEEEALLTRLGVRIVGMEEVEARGLEAVLREAVAIARGGTAGYGITLDLDALDPLDAPGVGTPVHGGIDAASLVRSLAGAANDEKLVGMEIVEYNPHRDIEHRTAAIIEEVIAAALGVAPKPIPT
jgi:arginase